MESAGGFGYARPVRRSRRPGKDRVFDTPRVDSDFAFNEQVAAVFDDMLPRSVPFYAQVIEAITELAARLARPNDLVVDVGCSTCTTLLALAADPRTSHLRLLGIDSSAAMIAQAKRKAARANLDGRLSLLCQDAAEARFQDAGLVLLNYTLQFVRPPLRPELMARLFSSMRSGGALIVSEKVIIEDGTLNRVWIDVYHSFKRRNGYSQNEIMRKREALENVMVPYTLAENQRLLRDAGFHPVEVFCRWFNFVTLVALKP